MCLDGGRRNTLKTTGTKITRTGVPATIDVRPQADLALTKTGNANPLVAGVDVLRRDQGGDAGHA